MTWPASLDADIVARSFHCGDGEIGILAGDVSAFLDACERDGLALLGWDLWLVAPFPKPMAGLSVPMSVILGVVPGFALLAGGPPTVIHGTGDIAAIRRDLAAFAPERLIAAAWLPCIRINFTLADETGSRRS
jgi:hypothetical protein